MTADALLAQPKVAVARAAIRAVNPWSEIATIHGDLATLAPTILSGISAAAICVDGLETRFAATRLLHAARVAAVDVGARGDLRTARATVWTAGDSCLVCSWGEEQLARAGADPGVACAAVTTAAPFTSTLACAQAAAALASDQLLALTGAMRAPARSGAELRLDLQRGRLDVFRLPHNASCAADHDLAAPQRQPLAIDPTTVSLGELLTRAGAGPETTIVLATTAIVVSAACRGCGRTSQPLTSDRTPLGTCAACGHDLVAVRRVRRLAWGEVATTAAAREASTWFGPGELFVLLGDGGSPRAFVLPAPPVLWEAGRAWDEIADPPRFSRLPSSFDLETIRATRIAVLGLGHVGGAVLQALAALPWRGILLVDRDHFEIHNLAAHPLAVRPAAAAAQETP